MHKCFLTAAIFFSLLSLELIAQNTPLDQYVRDSLFRVKPNETSVQQGYIYLEISDLIQLEMPQKSFSYIVSAFKIAVLTGNSDLKAKARIRMADYYFRKRDFMHAQEQYMAAWKTYQAISDTAGEANALANIGILNRSLKNYESSLHYLQMGVVLAERTGDKALLGMLFGHMGQTYQAMQDPEASMHYYNKAITLFRQSGKKREELRVQSNIGSVFMDGEKNAEALAVFNKLLTEADAGDTELLGILYTRIGHIYYKNKDYRTSLKFNLKALHTRQGGRNLSEVNSSLINIAGDYFNLDKPDSGKIYMDTGLLLAQRADRKQFIVNAYRHLYGYYLRKEDYFWALNYFARYSAVQDEINREKSRSNIGILEATKQLSRIRQSGKMMAKDKSIQALDLNLHKYQMYILLVLMGLAGVSMIIFIFLLLYVRRVRQKMQEINVQLSDEIREREVMELQTRDREKQYKFITDNSVDFISHLDHNKVRIYASPSSVDVYGYSPVEIMSKSPADLMHPDFYAYADLKFGEMIETRSSKWFTYKARKKDGTLFWVESILNPLFDPVSGGFKGVVAVTRDIQERKTKEFEIMEGTKQKENLLKEIHHRVKNNFAILVSLINMQMAQAKNPELVQSLTNLQLRIRTMALVHEMLYRSSDFEKISFPGYLRSLASVIAGTYNRRDIELSVEAEEVVMDIEASIPLGLIVNELLSNAYKHAFPAERAGKIRLRFAIDQKTGLNTLEIKDDGTGMQPVANTDQLKTMGLQIVQILCTQIEATLVIANDPGTSFTITFQTHSK